MTLDLKVENSEKEIMARAEKIDPKSAGYADQIEKIFKDGLDALEDGALTIIVEAQNLYRQKTGLPTCTFEITKKDGVKEVIEVEFAKTQTELDRDLQEMGTEFRSKYKKMEKEMKEFLEDVRKNGPPKS
jgi:hypothetical protein